MTTRLIHHQRIVTLRELALQGATYHELEQAAKKMGVSDSTVRRYLQEVVKDLQRIKHKSKLTK